MRQVSQSLNDGVIKVIDAPEPLLRPHGVLVRNHFSLISAGTERAKVETARSSLVGKARRRPEDVKRVLARVRRDGILGTYKMVRERLDALSPLGYACAGTVTAAGELAEGVRPGDLVACAGAGYANHADVVYVPHNLCAKVPEGVGADEAAFATLGAVALQGFRQSGAVLGDTVAVIGLGLLGQLSVQIAKASGCVVLGVDLDARKNALAERLGADAVATAGAEAVSACGRLTASRGADVVLITAAAKSSEPVALAGALARDRGVVVVVGDVGMDLPRSPYYEKELTLRLSRSYGPGRYDASYEEFGIDYPEGYVPWSERRNLEEVLRLIADRRLDVRALTTHTFDVAAAKDAYAVVMGETGEEYLGVLLGYGEAAADQVPRPVAAKVPKPQGALGVSLVGAGNFATATLLPALKAVGGISLRRVTTAGGLSAADVAQRHGFAHASSTFAEVIDDAETDAVIVSTRHSDHAASVVAALGAGKHVFVEKPLAVTREQLDSVADAWSASTGEAMVGFNRRYAPLTRRLADFLGRFDGPVSLQVRVNAGPLPKEHWTQLVEEGGGRIVGEMCHFVDLACALTGAVPVTVFARGAGNGKSAALQDSVHAVIDFADGSVASVLYCADGDPALGKERIEAFRGGAAAVLEDFRTLVTVRGGRSERKTLPAEDKGHAAEMRAFVQLARGGGGPERPFESAAVSSLATLAIIESLGAGAPVPVGTMPLDRGA